MAYRPSESGMFTPTTMLTTAPDDTGEGFSVIDRQSNFDGVFVAKRDLRIEGEVKGSIECSGTLFIAQGASVNARVEAENITVAGEFTGEINCRGRLQVMPSGRVRGKVMTKSLVINEGAYYEGEMEMVPETRVGPGTPPRALPTAPVTPAPRQAPVTPPSQPQQQSAPISSPSSPPPASSAQGDSGSRTFIRRFGGPETAWDTDGEHTHDQEAGAEDRP